MNFNQPEEFSKSNAYPPRLLPIRLPDSSKTVSSKDSNEECVGRGEYWGQVLTPGLEKLGVRDKEVSHGFRCKDMGEELYYGHQAQGWGLVPETKHEPGLWGHRVQLARVV